MTDKRYKLAIEIEADEYGDLDLKLREIQFDLVCGKVGPMGIFASPGCVGSVRLTDAGEQ